jgi:phosphoribosyl-AMP cyclohydrolase
MSASETPSGASAPPTPDTEALLAQVKFGADGLVTAVAVDDRDGEVVMLAHMNRESLGLTLSTGVMTYWSRSRKKLWLKGETSGNTQKVVSARIDCDGDALLFRVLPQGVGAACHEGYKSCFFREREGATWATRGKPLQAPGPA